MGKDIFPSLLSPWREDVDSLCSHPAAASSFLNTYIPFFSQNDLPSSEGPRGIWENRSRRFSPFPFFFSVWSRILLFLFLLQSEPWKSKGRSLQIQEEFFRTSAAHTRGFPGRKKGRNITNLKKKQTTLPKDSVLRGKMVVVLRHTKRQKSEKKILHRQSPRKIPFCILSSWRCHHQNEILMLCFYRRTNFLPKESKSAYQTIEWHDTICDKNTLLSQTLSLPLFRKKIILKKSVHAYSVYSKQSSSF